MEGPYVRELKNNQPGLQFRNRRLESEFQLYAAAHNSTALRIQLLLGALLVCAISILDFTLLDPEFSMRAVPLRLGIMLSAILVMLTLTYVRGGGRYLEIAGVAVGLSVGLTSLVIASMAAQYQLPRVFAGYQIVIVFVYFFLGLRVAVAISTGTALFVAFIVAAMINGANPIATTYNALYLVFLNVIGALGCYQLSKARRTVFLEERILSYRANHDALTELPNRRAFDAILQSNWDNSRELCKPIAVMMIDIDHFKNYNDIYGHQAGDRAISAVAGILKDNMKRPQDFAGRYGGEEFVVLLFDATHEYTLELAERIRTQLHARNIPHKGSGAPGRVTVSIGLAHIEPHRSMRSVKGLVQMADEALYAAKAQGRNCVVDSNRALGSTTTGIFRVAQIDELEQAASGL